MKISVPRRILREDLKDAPDWIVGLITPLNSFIDTYFLLANKNIDEANLASQIIELEVVTPSTYPTMDPVKFTSQLRTQPQGLCILQAYEKRTGVPVATMNPAWTANGRMVSISQITGLSASKTYVIRFRLT